MRIAIFEWICGGGMLATQPAEIPSSLLQEGWAMLSCLAESLARADHDVAAALDPRVLTGQLSLPGLDRLTRSVDFYNCTALTRTAQPQDAVPGMIAQWKTLAGHNDLSIIIAPEIDDVLQGCVDDFLEDRLPLLNCSGDFLIGSSSKLRTAQLWTEQNLPTPPTVLASKFDPAQLRSSSNLWCVKPVLGAGCDGLQVGQAGPILSVIDSLEAQDRWIVQPWFEGQAYSCSCIVDSHGNADWMPLVTQRLQSQPGTEQTTKRLYCGGELILPELMMPPVDLLNRALLALRSDKTKECRGWVGVDLLLQPDGQWSLIEVNPRLTTSVIGLSRAAPINLGQRMIDAFEAAEREPLLEMPWNSLEFSPSGQSSTVDPIGG